MQSKPILIHTHFHKRRTGVTRSIENVFPFFETDYDAFAFGSTIKTPKISLFQLLKLVFSKKYFVLHCHRNNEIIRSLFLKMLGGNFKLISTRHAESKPSALTKFLLKKSDVIVTLTKSMATSLSFPTVVVGHGVDTTIFKPNLERKLPFITQKNIITCAGRVREAKGQKVLIEAISPLLKVSTDWSLVIVGKVDKPSFLEKLKTIVGENQVVGQVYFLPETPEIVSIYQASHTVVVPSFTEGFSLVCAEAMACGCNVIATENVGIHSELITHNQNGYLFQPGNTSQLQQLVFKLIKGELTHLGVPARKTITDHWGSKAEAEKLMKLYKQH